MKIVMTSHPGGQGPGEGKDDFVEDLRASFPEVDFQPVESVEEQIEHIRDAEVFHGWMPREVFLAARQLRWIHCPGTGIDGLTQIPELVESDVVVTNARGPHVNPMADHVFGLMITLAHKLHEMWDDQKAKRWRGSRYHQKQVELAGRTMGILALGDIGTAVARRAQGFGMEVYAVDKYPKPSAVAREVWGLERLDDLLAMSDWFVVAAPFTAETRGLIDRRRLSVLKDGAFVIVISRGGIVDEGALVEGLRAGRIAGAGLDALDLEPPVQDNPLWDLDNVVITPHSSGVTPELFTGRRRIFKENVRRYLANEPFLSVCDKRDGF